MSSVTRALRRVPFRPAEVDRWAAFCLDHGGPQDAALIRRLLLELTSAPTGVFAFDDGAEPVVVCTVIDLAINGSDHAILEILGAREPIAAEPFLELIVVPAIVFAQGGRARGLQVGLPPSLLDVDGAAQVLMAEGFTRSHESLVMRRPAGRSAPPVPPLDAGWRWETLAATESEAAHQALREMFRGAPSFGVAPLDNFRKTVASGASVWRVLYDGAAVAGLVQVSSGPRRGLLRTVGRLPHYRRRGLGELLVAEGVRTLVERGVEDIELDVEADNNAALALYRRFGFEVAHRTQVLSRSW